jgi:hypothetical protein
MNHGNIFSGTVAAATNTGVEAEAVQAQVVSRTPRQRMRQVAFFKEYAAATGIQDPDLLQYRFESYPSVAAAIAHYRKRKNDAGEHTDDPVVSPAKRRLKRRSKRLLMKKRMRTTQTMPKMTRLVVTSSHQARLMWPIVTLNLQDGFMRSLNRRAMVKQPSSANGYAPTF